MGKSASLQTQEALTSRLKQPRLIIKGGLKKTMTLTELMSDERFFEIPSKGPDHYWVFMKSIEKPGRYYALTVVYKQAGNSQKAVCLGRIRYTIEAQ